MGTGLFDEQVRIYKKSDPSTFHITPTDMENMPPKKITDIGYIHNSNVYLKYSAYKNCRYQIYFKAFTYL
jgi:hypothetical protein